MADCIGCGADKHDKPNQQQSHNNNGGVAMVEAIKPISIPVPANVLAQQRLNAAAAAGTIGAGGRVVIPRAADVSRPAPIIRNRVNQSTATSGAARPGAGAEAVLNKLSSFPAIQQLANLQPKPPQPTQPNPSGPSGKGGVKAQVTAAPPPPANIAEVAKAAGLPAAAQGMKQAASNVSQSDEFFNGLWKNHSSHADFLKSDLQSKLKESMDQIKSLDLKNLTKNGALSGFDRDIETSRLTATDVENAEYMKTEKLSIPDSEILDIPTSDFMAKRLADNEAKFAAATAKAIQAASQNPNAPQTASTSTSAASATPSTQQASKGGLSVAQAAQINQNIKTTEMRDRRARYANQKREQMNIPQPQSTVAAATPTNPSGNPLGNPPGKGGYAPLGSGMATSALGAAGFPGAAGSGGIGASLSGLGSNVTGKLGEMTNQLKEKVAQNSPELSQQAELVQGLAAQLQNWNTLASKMGSLQTYMGVFGKHVRLMMGIQDDARHYSVQHYRGPLLTLLDNDTVKWYRRNDIAQSFANAGCSLTWQGSAPAPDEGNQRGKRFQLQWHDLVVDSQQRTLTIGTSWNAGSQRQDTAIARFSPDGKTLDPSFYCPDEKLPGVGAIQTSIFKTESRGVQCLISNDQMRILMLSTVFDQELQQLIGTVVALRSTDGKQDTTFGDKGTVGITMPGYAQGCIPVRMSQHPITGDLLILLRVQTDNLPVNKLTSVFLKLIKDGSFDPSSVVLVDADSNPNYPNVWLATDITWHTPFANDRSKDKIIVVGTIVSQLGDELSQPFVRQYWADGQIDTTFGSPLSAFNQYLSKDIVVNDESSKIGVIDIKNDMVNGSVSAGTAEVAPAVSSTAQFFNSLNEADAKETTGGLLEGSTKSATTVKSLPQVASTGAVVAQKKINGGGSGSGLLMITVPNSTVSTAQRVLVYDKYVEVLGVAYDDVQGTFGVSFICQIDLSTQNQNLMLFQLADVYQTTVAQNFAIDFATGTRLIVGYALHNSTQIDSADAFAIKLDGAGKILQKSRLSLGGEYFQSLTAVAVDPVNKRFVSTGLTQTGKTIYTRLGCILHGPSI